MNKEEILNKLEWIEEDLIRAIDGKRYDPSWMRPLPLTYKQRKEYAIDALNLVKHLKEKINGET